MACTRISNAWSCSGTQRINDAQVSPLVHAVSVAAPHFTLLRAGFNPALIHMISQDTASSIRGNLGITPPQIKKAKSLAWSGSYVERYLIQTYTAVGIRHTDDYPYVAITVTGADNHRIYITSRSQKDYMIPWVIGENGTIRTSYNIGISSAVAALLPKSDPNYDRLATPSDIEDGIAQQAEDDAIR
jgi:hypothetical protein